MEQHSVVSSTRKPLPRSWLGYEPGGAGDAAHGAARNALLHTPQKVHHSIPAQSSLRSQPPPHPATLTHPLLRIRTRSPSTHRHPLPQPPPHPPQPPTASRPHPRGALRRRHPPRPPAHRAPRPPVAPDAARAGRVGAGRRAGGAAHGGAAVPGGADDERVPGGFFWGGGLALHSAHGKQAGGERRKWSSLFGADLCPTPVVTLKIPRTQSIRS
jgi:hypothetical protein